MSDDPYGDFKTDNGNLNAVLNQLADELLDAEAEVVRIEEELATAKKLVEEIASKRIPAVTDGLEGTFNLGNGRKLVVDEVIRASVAGEKLAPAVKWLDDNDFGGIVKREVIFSFGKDDHEKVKAFRKAIDNTIKQMGLVAKEKNAIHPQTLLSFVREKLKDGVVLPKETFGIFRQSIAKVKED